MELGLGDIKRVHCVGIGGIGVSAIARMLHREGKRVTGSDTARSPVTAMLARQGIRVRFGHRASNLGDADLVVYTKAASPSNPELKAARRCGIPCLSYAEMLGVISRERYTVAVAGTHGKTTTTAMVGEMLRDAGFDPTVIVGGIIASANSNFVAGRGRYFVVEACEYKKSFLGIHPRIIVITNIDNDHLDYYKNLRNIERAFAEFAAELPENGYLVCDPRDPRLRWAVRRTLRLRSGQARATVVDYTKSPKQFRLKVWGAHNLTNAQAAYTVGRILGISPARIRKSLGSFRGVGRRMECRGTWRGVRFYDDYAHHPTEIRATLRAAREHFGERARIWCVFQPHLYSRTRLLMKEFATSFRDVNGVLLADIYAAREKNDGRTNSRVLAEKIDTDTPALYLSTFPRIAAFLQEHAKRGDVVITMGAGEAYKVWELVGK